MNRRLAIFAAVLGSLFLGFAALDYAPSLLGCTIKGNLSAGGERIYHLQGQMYYSQTRINWLRGERWFCSEASALAAGWRRARI
ncbi:hypothetical protein ACVIHI_003413 [Bradyrhizobium sp. USDA 4524]|nr:hypothetical protein [Bradyrhizobium sp. USDA 4538]MCP1904234.1 hypothetical protein [Bradyrhizobium sp. USDA 4537]MCP1990110.1 hypothetical protein [Bradyrhizobium sp. USDA 4539]